jgi:hypothetical protein
MSERRQDERKPWQEIHQLFFIQWPDDTPDQYWDALQIAQLLAARIGFDI